jgi:Flp pilus assembly protein TadG
MSDIRRKISGLGFIGSLMRDNRGAIAVYIAIITPVMIGVGAMTLDIGRLITLNTELQYAADAASLAGARELDRFPGAIARGRAAAQGAIANIQTFAGDGGGKGVAIDTTECANPPVAPCVRFLKSLPIDDDDPIQASDVTTKDDEARFMEVHVGARAITNALIQLVTLGNGPSTISTVASAVAGNDQVICRVPPMFMCNPTEPDTNIDLNLQADLSVLEGRQIEMFHQGGTGQYTPGNFGLLCPTGTEGSPCGAGFIRDALASTTGTCVSLQVAETKTGVTLQMVRTGINARHDYFTPQAKNSDNIPWRTLDEFVPAANVTQGAKPPNNTQGNQTKCEYDDIADDSVNAAGQTVDEWIAADPINNTADNFVAEGVEETAMGLPRDQCINADNCATAPGNVNGNRRIGDGIWDYVDYFRINHGCNPSTNPTCKPADWDGVTGAGWPPTRYETYRYEIETAPETIVMPNQTIYDASGVAITQTAENGHDQCFKGTPPVIPGYNYFPAAVRDLTLLNDRRIMPLAIANCNAMETLGLKTSGKFKFKIPQFLYVFITEPMKLPSTSEIHAEILGELEAGAVKDLSHDVVQIYRR